MVQSGNAITGTTHSTRSTPFSIVPHGNSAKSHPLLGSFLPSFPHVNVTRLFTDPHALWGLMRVNSTPPIQELDFRQRPSPCPSIATSATRATKYYLHMQP